MVSSGLSEVSPDRVFDPPTFNGMCELCLKVTKLWEADTADLLVKHGSKLQVLASYNSMITFHTYPWTEEDAPYSSGDQVFWLDLHENPEVMKIKHFIDISGYNQFIRFPVFEDSKYSFVLIIYGHNKGKMLDAEDMREFQSLILEIAALCRHCSKSMSTRQHRPCFPCSLSELLSFVNNSREAMVLFDNTVTAIDVNLPYKKLRNQGKGVVFGHLPPRFHQSGIGQYVGTIYTRALEMGFTSPELEVRDWWEGAGYRGVVGIRATPVTVCDQQSPYLLVTYRKIGQPAHGDQIAADLGGNGDPTKSAPETVLVDFLHETLVRKRAIRSRKSISFFTLNTWRRPIREHQIKAFRSLKHARSVGLAALAAREMFEDINSIIGIGMFRAIIPVPCGHSNGDFCLSYEIANQLALLANLPVVNAFSRQKLAGSSHPKTNTRRPPLKLINHYADPAILVDDIATSGQHLEEAVTLLRGHSGSILAVAWIGSEGSSTIARSRKA